ncbi:MAG: hypothetical protein CL920_20225 [Deltaproteobacteria bacterium]|nr:hypothetical protein [Deltaproteobacteria bacterium]MBU51019.1 hypothetical protein [Deltaproteobacteria bacterium]
MGRYLVWLLCSCMLFACSAEPHDQFGVLGQEVIGDCQVTASIAPSTTQAVGSIVTLSGVATCVSGSPEYKFYVRTPNGVWNLLRDWGASTFSWDSTGAWSGDYLLQVWVRRQGESIVYEGASQSLPFTLQGGKGLCTGVQFSMDKTSPQAAGTAVTLSMTPSCQGSAAAEYKVYRRTPLGVWVIESDWNKNTSFTWSTAAVASGTHFFQVWVRAQGSNTVYDGASVVQSFDVTGSTRCTSVTFATNPISPQPVGTSVTFVATGLCNAGVVPEFKFWHRAPSGAWSVLRDWGTQSSATWNTAGLAKGVHIHQVWVRKQGSTEVYEAISVSAAFTLQSWQVSTFAGSGIPAYINGSAPLASFHTPVGVTVDEQGNVYVVDDGNARVRKVTPGGQISLLAGSGTSGYKDGVGAQAAFRNASGIVVDGNGTLYVADTDNHVIRKITPTGVVTTFAGSGVAGYQDGAGTQAQFDQPMGIAIDVGGVLYVSDVGNLRIRKITSAGVVSTFAGSGLLGAKDGAALSASFGYPNGIAVTPQGAVIVVDMINNKIRKISSGVVSTIAGTGAPGYKDGAGAAALFHSPWGAAVDARGNIYVSELLSGRLRKINIFGVVSTFAGTGVPGFKNGLATDAQFFNPMHIAINESGHLFVADSFNHRIRKIAP